MTAPTITPLPDPPQRANEPASFVTKADAWVAAMAPLTEEINAFGTYLNTYVPGGGYGPGGTDVALADGGTGASLSDPGADRIMFWDDSANSVTWLALGTGLSISGTTITATASGSAITAKDEGSNLTTALASLNFVGSGVTATTVGDAVTVTINASAGAGAVVTLTDAATVTVDCSLGNNFRWTIGGNRTFANPTNPTDGQLINIRIIQDGTGGRTWTLGSKFKFSGGSPLLSTAANAKDLVTCQYDVNDDTWFCAIAKGMA